MESTSPTPAAAYPSIGQSLLIVGIIVLMTTAASILILPLERWIGSEAATLVFYVTGMGSSFYIVHGLRRRRVGSTSYDFRPGSWQTVLALALGSLALMFGLVSPITGMIPMPEFVKEIARTMVGEVGLSTFLYFVIGAPVLEELIFRGIVLDGLLRRYSSLTAILVSSLLFGLVHLNPWQFVTGFVLGCFAGWVYLRTRSVGACIVIHMAANLNGYLMRVFVDIESFLDEGVRLVDSYGGGAPRYVAVTAGSLALFLATVYFLRAEFDRRPAQPEILGRPAFRVDE